MDMPHFLDTCNICDVNPANPSDPAGNCDECTAPERTTLLVTVDHPHAAMEADLLLRMVGITTHGGDRTSDGFAVANADVDDAFKVLAGIGGVLSITGRPE